jgi:hypothetical protein
MFPYRPLFGGPATTEISQSLVNLYLHEHNSEVRVIETEED